MAGRPRGPGATYAVLSLAIVVLLAVLALSARQPPPPTIAEFAPQAVENITDSPSDQSSSSGKGVGDCLGGGPCDAGPGDGGGATPTPTPIAVARVRKCVGDPPRQIEDPQSPPCVPYWSGDNGGATYKGVTRDEIRLLSPGDDVSDSQQLLQSFFNRRFEFYGRQLRLFNDCGSGSTPQAQRAVAVCADEQDKVFAATDFTSAGGSHFVWEMARRKLITSSHLPQFDSAFQAENAPYVWQYTPPADTILATVGRWTCAELAGRNATHAGDPLYTQQRRTFGIVFQTYMADIPVNSAPLESELKRCGESVKEKVEYCSHCGSENGGGANRSGFNAEGSQNAVIRMRAAGVTSVLCMCLIFGLGNVLKFATQQEYFPEWIVSTYIETDSIFQMRTWASSEPSQTRSAFGLRFRPKAVSWPDSPSAWALKEANPAYPDPNLVGDEWSLHALYRTLLLIASGIQMAGPHLTVETFTNALHRTRFPNPAHPIMAGAVGFPNGGFSMVQDVTRVWWTNTAPGGGYCYIDGGVRHPFEGWQRADDRFFAGTCDVPGGNE